MKNSKNNRNLSSQRKIGPAEKNLIQRYLIWCYKTTKEELDRIDRKFTQLMVDEYILKRIAKAQVEPQIKSSYQGLIDDFKEYMKKKEGDFKQSKFRDAILGLPHPNYVYLSNRLSAIEEAIGFFLGKKKIQLIQSLYEEEMTTRILQAKEH